MSARQCLVKARTGNPCQSCRRRATGGLNALRCKNRYQRAKANGVCVRCAQKPATHGVFCQRHHVENAEKNRLMPRKTVRRQSCFYCGEKGHNSRTCPTGPEATR